MASQRAIPQVRPTETGTGPIRHRVAPAPVGSGISFRQLPSASFASVRARKPPPLVERWADMDRALQIIRACQHYEEKAAGSVDAKSLSVRCLYDLSREVQDIVRVLKTNEDAQSARVRDLEQILREWNELFADPSARLQAAGVTRSSNSPAALSRHIMDLASTVKQRELDSTAQRVSYDKEITDLRTALRDSARVHREEAARQLAALKAEAEGVIAQERAAKAGLAEQLEHLRANVEQRVASDTAFRVEEQTRALRAQVANVEHQLDEADAAAASAARAADRDVERLKGEIDSLQDEMRDMMSAHRDSYAEFTTRTGADAARARAECAHAERVLAATEAEWADKYAELQERWEHSTGAVRVSYLTEQLAFYKSRTRELQEIAQSMQNALLTVPSVSAGVRDSIATYRKEGQGAARGGLSMSLGEPGPVEASASFSQSFAGSTAAGLRAAGSRPGGGSPGDIRAAPGSAHKREQGQSAGPSVRASAVGPSRPMATTAVVRHAAGEALGPRAGSAPTETHYFTVR